PVPSDYRNLQVCILGAGIAGLSAARELDKAGRQDWMMLDLEEQAGGNAAWGANSITAYPWGAHYLPLPNTESEYVRTLLEEFGLITSYDSSGLPYYKEEYLCHAPEERLKLRGEWKP